ncbi:MAG: hypothetical protein GC137_07020 [Alphaproteobacteria bacterium]|nr:hypothetical protein [Alphaproteobacteria bacterium]
MDTSDKKTPEDEIEELDEIWDDLDDLDDFEEDSLGEDAPLQDVKHVPEEPEQKPDKKSKKKEKKKSLPSESMDDDALAIPKKSNKTRNIMIGALIILGAGAYSFGPLVMQMIQQSAPSDIPVVQIEEAEDTLEAQTDIAPETAEIDVEPQDMELPDFQPLEPSPQGIENLTTEDTPQADEFTAEEPAPVLTPFPESSDSADISLTDLIPQPENEGSLPLDEAVEQPIVQPQENPEQPTSLNDLIGLEQEMLNKTETPFADDVIDDVMNNAQDAEIIEQPEDNSAQDNILSDLLDTPIENPEPAIVETLQAEEPEPVVEEQPEPIIEETNTPINEAEPVIEPETSNSEKIEEDTAASEAESDFNIMPDKKPAAPEKPVQPEPAVETTKTAPKQTSTAPQKAPPKWIIRAAQPGNAVIFDLNTKEMKSIEPGSTVQGIGKVKEIGFKDGKWFIQGTAGKIEQ